MRRYGSVMLCVFFRKAGSMKLQGYRRRYSRSESAGQSPVELDNRNILLHELIGLEVRVVNSHDPKQIGTEGKVHYETKNTLEIATREGIKKVVKKISTFKFITGKKSYIVKGGEISFRPYERIEKSQKFCKKRA